MFPGSEIQFDYVSADSGVSKQPQNEQEAFTGATNRANNASQQMPEADYWVGQESGIDSFQEEMTAYGWVVVKSRAGNYGKAKTSMFFLPPAISTLVQQGKDLGEADDIVFGRTNANQVNGAVGLLTGDQVTRTSYFTDAVIMALIPFKNPELYQ